ncbi:MAG: hypothetical protein EB127_23775 [Alphaproteobacteria bacterium]|nr:hypothetical protein [Alphaproteobacteria bacterium]
MTIFDYLTDILVKKSGTLPTEEYVPFLVNRWLSFSSPQVCQAINSSVNSLTLDKDKHYKLLLAVFPKQAYMPKINYIKKIKNEKTEEDNKLDLLSKNMELSKREIKQLLELKEIKH